MRGGKRLRLVATYAKGASKRQVRKAQQQHMPERSPNDGSPLEETALDIRQAIEMRREECADRRRDDEIGRCLVAKTTSVRDGLVRRCTQRTARRLGAVRPPHVQPWALSDHRPMAAQFLQTRPRCDAGNLTS